MLELDIQRFADGKVVIDTELDTKNFDKGLNKIQSTTKSAGSTIKNIVAGLGITKAISFAMNQITGSIDGAVSRIDTLNQFPKVMSNLGISAEESQEAISKMSDKLAGLPTTLDQGASAVQRFTSKNGNVKKSTDLFLALNNAILAGGASSEIQASALEQLSQAYAKGKPDMMEWRTAMTAMPAQLKQVAKAMGYVDADALGEALRNGTVSMDEFMDTITKLNTEGVDGFQSFEKQARNSTGGIGTAITVAKTQVTKGVADIIKALNTKMEKSGKGNISDYIENMGKDSKKGLDDISKLISGEMSPEDFGKKATDMISLFVEKFTENLPKIAEQGIETTTELIKGMAEGTPNLITKITDLILTIPDIIEQNSDKILDAGSKLLDKLAEGFENNFPRIVEAVNKIMNTMLNKMQDPATQEKIIQTGVKVVIALGLGIIKALPTIISNTMLIPNAIISTLVTLPQRVAQIGVETVKSLWNGFKSFKMKDKMYKWGKDMLDGLISGLNSKISNVGKSAKKIADKIGSYLHFSKPDEGPLREYEKWMPDMIKGLSKSMKNNDNILINQTKELAEKIKKNMNFNDIYEDMQNAIDLEQGKLLTSVETGKVFNTLQNSTPVVIDLNADVEMDSQKVGRLITPAVSRTIKSGGGY